MTGEPPIPMRANWFRFSVIALDVVPGGLRLLSKRKSKSRYANDWRDDGTEGIAFIHGGTLLPCDIRLPGYFTAEAGQTVVKTSGDVTACGVKGGDCIRFGDFITIVVGAPKSPGSFLNKKTSQHGVIPGQIVLPKGKVSSRKYC